jgi:hypothetical protein
MNNVIPLYFLFVSVSELVDAYIAVSLNHCWIDVSVRGDVFQKSRNVINGGIKHAAKQPRRNAASIK